MMIEQVDERNEHALGWCALGRWDAKAPVGEKHVDNVGRVRAERRDESTRRGNNLGRYIAGQGRMRGAQPGELAAGVVQSGLQVKHRQLELADVVRDIKHVESTTIEAPSDAINSYPKGCGDSHQWSSRGIGFDTQLAGLRDNAGARSHPAAGLANQIKGAQQQVLHHRVVRHHAMVDLVRRGSHGAIQLRDVWITYRRRVLE